MTYNDLIQVVADRTGLPATHVRKVLGTFVDALTEELVHDRDVRVPGLGSFKAKWRAPRTVRSIVDRQAMFIDGRWTPHFSPAAALRRALESKTPQHWRDDAHQDAWRMADTLVDDLFLYHANQAPQSSANMSPEEVEARCARSFGPLWDRVVETYEATVPADIRSRARYLGLAAGRRLETA